jgi:hypothetical protein
MNILPAQLGSPADFVVLVAAFTILVRNSPQKSEI